MTNDFSGPDGPLMAMEYASRPASANADADGHAHRTVIPLKDIDEPRGSASYELALSGLTEAAIGIAKDKNVTLPESECAAVARIALDSFRPEDVQRILQCRMEPVTLAAGMINRIIDVLAAERVIALICQAENIPLPSRYSIIAQCEAWMRNLDPANASGDMRLRWPDTPALVAAFYRSRVSGPVSITLPAGQAARARYYLDRAPLPHHGRMPLIIRLPPVSAHVAAPTSSEGASS